MIFKTIKYAYFRIFFHHNLQDTGSNNPLESCGIGRYFHTVIQSMERCLLARLADLHRTDNKKRFEEGVLPLTQGKQYDIISIIILVVIKLYVRVLTIEISASHSSCIWLASLNESHQKVVKKLSKINQNLCRVATAGRARSTVIVVEQ